jgi:hypothetical protein
VKVTVHLPNGLPADQLPGVVEDLRRHFPDAGAFVGLSTDEELLELVHAAFPQADILVRFYGANRMGARPATRAGEDLRWLERHPWVKHVTPANELNLRGEHGPLPPPGEPTLPWDNAEAYVQINDWLINWAALIRVWPGLILHWPALSPQHDELEHLHLCAKSLRSYDVVDIHWYGEPGLFPRLAAYQDAVMVPPVERRFAPREAWPRFWVTETNQGLNGDMRDFMRHFHDGLRIYAERGDLEVFSFFIYDSADPAFDWCKLRGRPEELLWAEIAREAKDWPTTPTPVPVPPPGGNMLKDTYPDVYAGWLAEQGGADAVLAGHFEDHGVAIGLRSPSFADALRLAERASSVAGQLQSAVRRLPKA